MSRIDMSQITTRKEKSYLSIVTHYENCFKRFGDSHLGVDWLNKEDAESRYRVMLEIIGKNTAGKTSVLDFGCGVSGLYDYILDQGISYVDYSGLDISSAFTEASQKKYPKLKYFNVDILDPDTCLPQFDYIVMNGVFTEKLTLSFGEMFNYFCAVTEKTFPFCNRGMAFNVRSELVDKLDDDLFHLSMDKLARFISEKISRNFTIRNDYGLEEYTVYVYRNSDMPVYSDNQ